MILKDISVGSIRPTPNV